MFIGPCLCCTLLSRINIVLTKVFVYCGIGMLACGIIPVMFEVLGWGVHLR